MWFWSIAALVTHVVLYVDFGFVVGCGFGINCAWIQVCTINLSDYYNGRVIE